jgi:transcriptional regulator with XRE-family HTH domain
MSPYEDLLGILAGLPLLVRETRRRRRMSMRDVSAVTGVSAPTIQRCEQGEQEVSLTNATRLLRWLALPDGSADGARLAAEGDPVKDMPTERRTG